ncbi:MAG: FAD-dependent oxidoreductase [Pseudomonadota bacterium]
MSKTSAHVAVIGAGAAGLVTADELLREGHAVTVFEAGSAVGGTWVYTTETEADWLGRTPSRRYLGSMYDSLRTNLPRNLMSFDNYPFDSRGGGHDSWPRFPGHAEVLEYLQRFADERHLLEHIRFNTRVELVTRSGSGWRVDDAPFDAVAVCNGHFSEPDVPEIEGAASFPGFALHSHSYRSPELLAEQCGSLADKTILLFGVGPSGIDLSRELAKHAKSVYLCGDRFKDADPPEQQETYIKVMGSVTRIDGSTVHCGPNAVDRVDVLIYCTGYRYHFPFLPMQRVEDGWVHGLYQQLTMIHTPSLAFIGLCFRLIPFPFFQRQARWFARLLAGRFELPHEAERRRSHDEEIAGLRAEGVRPKHTHAFSQDGCVDYLNRLARQCGDTAIPDVFVSTWAQHFRNVMRNPGGYRKADDGDANEFLWPSLEGPTA